MVSRFLFLFFLASMAALPASATAQPAAGDTAVTTSIARAITTYERFTIFDDVTMEVEGAQVTLRGKVTMPFKRDEIGRRARAAAPGYAIANEIGRAHV